MKLEYIIIIILILLILFFFMRINKECFGTYASRDIQIEYEDTIKLLMKKYMIEHNLTNIDENTEMDIRKKVKEEQIQEKEKIISDEVNARMIAQNIPDTDLNAKTQIYNTVQKELYDNMVLAESKRNRNRSEQNTQVAISTQKIQTNEERLKETQQSLQNDVTIDVMPLPTYNTNFKYETMEIITNNIEKFFNTYLNLINTNRINNKLKEYLVNNGDLTDISMQSIFTLKNLDLYSFSDEIYSLINKIYFSYSKNLDDNKIMLYGLFIAIKYKFSKLNNNIYTFNYYKGVLVLVPTKNQNFIITVSEFKDPSNFKDINEEKRDETGKVISSFSRNVNITEVDDINKCYDSDHINNKFCYITIKDFAGETLIKKYKILTDKIIEEKNKLYGPNTAVAILDYIELIRRELANNLYQIVLLCELKIVRELILAYNNALSTMENYSIDNYNNIISTDKFKNLEIEINNIKNNMKIYTSDADQNLTIDKILEV